MDSQHNEAVPDLLQRIAGKHGTSVEELRGHRRIRHIAWARQEAYAALRDQGYSYPSIACIFGKKDHTGVWSGVKQHEKRRAAKGEQANG